MQRSVPFTRGRRRTAAPMVASFLPFAACSDAVSVRSDLLIARMAGDRLELTNTSTRAVYFFAADREALAVVDWAPCIDPDPCEAVPPMSTRRLARDEVAFLTPATREIVVYHWHLVPAPGGEGVAWDEIRQLIVKVR